MRSISQSLARVGSAFFCVLALFWLALLQSQTASAQTGPSLAVIAQQGEKACLQAPHNVDLLSLPDEQLVGYGLPTHAIIAKDPQKWETNFAHLEHRTCGTSPSQTQHHQSTQNFTNCALGAGCPSSTWSGNEAADVAGTFRATDVSFVVPTIQTSDKNAAVSIWAGIGGDTTYDGNNVLVQAGVDISVDSSGHQTNESFWEVEPAQGVAQNLPLQRIAPGDQIFVGAASNDEFSGYNFFYIENGTTGDYNSHTDISTPLARSSTAECIVERPSVNGTPVDLADFNTVSFTGCDVTLFHTDGTSQTTGVGTIPHSFFTIFNTSVTPNKQLDSVGPIDSTGENYGISWIASS